MTPRGSAWRSNAWYRVARVCATGRAGAARRWTSGRQAQQQIHRALVRVGKLVAVELGRRHPAIIPYPPRDQPVFFEPRRVQNQLDRVAHILVPALAHLLADLDLGIESF